MARSDWSNPTAERRATYRQRCVPFYRHRRERPVEPPQAILKTEVAPHVNGPRNEQGRFDFHRDLAKLRCPVLMIGGERDPIVPISLMAATARSIPSHLVRFVRRADCGHDVHDDAAEEVFHIMREFILADAAGVG